MPDSTQAQLQANARDLEQELAWFAQVLDTHFKLYFSQETAYRDVFAIPPPDLSGSDSHYARFVRHYELSFSERVAVVLALTPHLCPPLLDVFFTKNKTFDRRFSEFGGIYPGPDGDFTPTGETLAFILAGADLASRFTLQGLFERDHHFAEHNILRLQPTGVEESLLKAPLRLTEEYLAWFTTGQAHRPQFGAQFPARFIETELEWDDLVLHPGTRRQIEEIATWIEHGATLMNDWGMAPKLAARLSQPVLRSARHR